MVLTVKKNRGNQEFSMVEMLLNSTLIDRFKEDVMAAKISLARNYVWFINPLWLICVVIVVFHLLQ